MNTGNNLHFPFKVLCYPILLLILYVSLVESKDFLRSPLKEFVTDDNVAPIVGVSDSRIYFGGRWIANHVKGKITKIKRSDWPCSYIRFDVNVLKEKATIPFIWYGPKTRLRVTVTSFPWKDIEYHQILESPTFLYTRIISNIEIPHVGKHTVTVRKLTSGAPYAAGIGGWIMGGSEFDFVGLGKTKNLSIVENSSVKNRSIVAIGGSDTSGWCVDGTPETSIWDFVLGGYRYEDCGNTFTTYLGKHFDADISVQAVPGIGLVRNDFSQFPFVIGKTTMPGYFNRTLMETNKYKWDFPKQPHVDLVLISLGGNDFNNHHIDLNEGDNFASKFTSTYVRYLLFLIQVFDENNDHIDYNHSPTKILNICGMGDPIEEEQKPNHNRCSPCPHIETAVHTFWYKYPELAQRVHYDFVPCDGSVINGIDDIGCNGHKNKLGQRRVAEYLYDKVSDITGWQ